ncbi:MAG: hypothetical protein COA52_02355 [Hyphomicrobiales bacterium]|nr:MAG: hypothetical protein COA52_02355 [Hyphomicrobiales bacterium]
MERQNHNRQRLLFSLDVIPLSLPSSSDLIRGPMQHQWCGHKLQNEASVFTLSALGPRIKSEDDGRMGGF